MPKRARSSSQPWVRVTKGGAHSVVDADRDVDADAVRKLLDDRAAFKAAKDYGEADRCAAALVALDVCFNDDAREWYTRVAGSGKQGGGAKKQKKVSTEKAEKLKRRKKRAAARAVDADEKSA